MFENIKVKGFVKWELIRNGQVVESGEDHNVFCNTGKKWLTDLLANAALGATSNQVFMGFGTGTTAADQTQTGLTTELTIGSNGYNRVTNANITKTSTITGNTATIQYVGTLTGLTAAQTIQEVGLFPAATGNTNIIARNLTGAVALSSASDSLQITWQINIS